MTHARLRLALALAIALAPAVAAQANVALETFESTSVGQPPDGWKARKGDIGGVYVVHQEEGRKFLRAEAKETGLMIGKEEKYDVKQYPILTWRWRVNELPKGGDERKKGTNDSAAGLYVVFGGRPIPKTIKYVWSSTLPVGTRTDSPYSDKTKIVVVASGPGKRGQWVEQQVNVLEDYRTLFGEDPPQARGIGILSDADNTRTRARADYAAIVARPLTAAGAGSAGAKSGTGKQSAK